MALYETHSYPNSNCLLRKLLLDAVNAFLIYLFVGLFGVGRYGPDTEGNILQNKWIGGGVAQGILNLATARES